MSRLFTLTWKYLLHHRGKSALLVLGLALVILLPLVLQGLIRHYERDLMARAEATPMVAGARGDRFDLVVNSLYFAKAAPGELPYGEAAALRVTGRANVLPLLARHQAGGAPVVGTTLSYYKQRGLELAEGSLPLRLGDCVLGSAAATRLELGPGDGLRSDQESMFDLTRYAVEMRVVGVLAERGTADDAAVFTDLRTAWVLDGHGHGHQDVDGMKDEPGAILKTETTNNTTKVVAGEQLIRFQEFTAENLASFHLHGAVADLPLTSILVFPHSQKDADLLAANYNLSPERQVLDTRSVMSELMSLVLKVKRWFNAIFAVFLVAMTLFLGLVVLLSLRLRRGEMATMFKLGCARGTMVRLQVLEWCLLLLAAFVLAAVLAFAVLAFAPDVRSLMG